MAILTKFLNVFVFPSWNLESHHSQCTDQVSHGRNQLLPFLKHPVIALITQVDWQHCQLNCVYLTKVFWTINYSCDQSQGIIYCQELSQVQVSTLGHLRLKVCSASIAAFRISLAILPHFVWISSKNFSFFIFQCFT